MDKKKIWRFRYIIYLPKRKENFRPIGLVRLNTQLIAQNNTLGPKRKTETTKEKENHFSLSLSLLNLKILNKWSVWIELILLKLKTENWKYCSKIIFKCVNSTVGPIFNKKWLKSDVCGSVNSAWMHCLQLKSQQNRLLKKIKNKKVKTQT